MKIIINKKPKNYIAPTNSPIDSRTDRFFSELSNHQREIEAEVRQFSAYMIHHKTLEVIA